MAKVPSNSRYVKKSDFQIGDSKKKNTNSKSVSTYSLWAYFGIGAIAVLVFWLVSAPSSDEGELQRKHAVEVLKLKNEIISYQQRLDAVEKELNGVRSERDNFDGFINFVERQCSKEERRKGNTSARQLCDRLSNEVPK